MKTTKKSTVIKTQISHNEKSSTYIGREREIEEWRAIFCKRPSFKMKHYVKNVSFEWCCVVVVAAAIVVSIVDCSVCVPKMLRLKYEQWLYASLLGMLCSACDFFFFV